MGELDRRQRMVVLAICCTSLLIVSMDATIINVALPALHRDLGASVSGLQWTIDSYTLVLASFLMLAGSTADRIGRRRVFRTGLAVFGTGSLLCSLAPGVGWLVAARVVQAAGGCMLNPVAMSIITNTFTDRVERARAIGMWGAVAGISLGLGPVVGGALVDSVGWRSIFWINVPVVVVALVATVRHVPESRAGRVRRYDLVGQLLVILTLGSLVYGIIEAPRWGWGSPVILGLFATAVLGAVGLLAWESRRAEPLLDPRFFRSLPFSGATAVAVAAFGVYGAFLFLNALYLQDVRGLSALHAGLYMLPVAALMVVLAPLSGRMVGRRGTRTPLVTAGLAVALSGLCLAWLSPVTGTVTLLGGYLLFGVGQGLVNPPITNSAVSGMPASMAGVAASVASTSRQTGTTLGVAIAGSVVGSSATRGGAEFTAAARPVWWLFVALGLVIAGVGWAISGPHARATAERAATLFEPVPTGRTP